MNTRMLALAILVAFTLPALPAAAFDGYGDRRGLYGGLLAGFGGGKTDADGDEMHIGVNFRGRVGGGVHQHLTLDADLGMQWAGYEQGGVDISRTLYLAFLGANFFLMDGLYLRAMGGVSHIGVKVDGGGDNSETGLGFGGGAGYEFFANADLAVGVLGEYQMHLYDKFNFSTINVGVTVNWY